MNGNLRREFDTTAADCFSRADLTRGSGSVSIRDRIRYADDSARAWDINQYNQYSPYAFKGKIRIGKKYRAKECVRCKD